VENHFGLKVRIYLKKQGLKQSDLAKLLDTSPQNVAALLKQANPNFSTINKVATALNIDPATFNTAGSSKPSLELIKTEGNSEFWDLGNARFLISTPVINQKNAKVYIKRLQDTEALAALPRHAVTTKELHFGEYLSVELETSVTLGAQKTNQARGSIVTGRKFANWTNPALGDLAGVDSILVFATEIVVATIKEYDEINRNITFNNSNKDEQTVNAHDILELYEIDIITNYDTNAFIN